MSSTNDKGAPSAFEPAPIEERVTRRWLESRAFAAIPDERDERYVVMMPLPNVTGALHMGHAIDNTMQDLLVRWHRMRGDNTLWMAGTDHAGIATQAVVEKRLKELEGKTRHDIGRDALIERIWAWKDQYQARIVRQQQAMGLSCDWDRQRFTMDAVCARAVRHTFFRMFAEGLIYRGKRLVNWDCELHTAISDDEIYYETVQGHFWHLRYPILDPKPGEPDHVVVATTRPETMLGDTAVACHPDPRGELDRAIAAARDKLERTPAKERDEAAAELERLEARRETHLPGLEQLAAMAADGRQVMLPLLERPIPLIRDEWAKPGLGSGCVKITPAHDPNDYEVWQRHADEIDIVNILEEDGRLNAAAGPYAGLDRFEARDRVVADLDARGALGAVEDRVIEIGHSDRSKTVIEPYWSDQWFVRMGDVEGGVVLGRGTPNEHVGAGLAQASIEAVAGDTRSPTGRKLVFHPDGDRYANTYLRWLEEKRDWCISRQLWWGHRIPIWQRAVDAATLDALRAGLAELDGREAVCVRIAHADGSTTPLADARLAEGEEARILACVREGEDDPALAATLGELALEQSPDVLDTWFSSALWPMSTLGWPEPETAEIDPGQSPLGSVGGAPDALSYYYPGSCLVTGRDIITLWVVRMVLMGLYNLGDLPFTDCFVHGNIQDGQGRKMSKSAGNGIDPVDIIEQYGADALRYVMCDLQTGNQDIRLPVSAISPYTGELVDLATAKHGSTKYTYLDPTSGKEFDVLGTMEDVPSAKLVSDRFVVGRNFMNKVWNAARFAFRSLEGASFEPRAFEELAVEDRWILSRLSRATRTVHGHLEAYNPSAAIGAAREFFWSELCDWYVELVKPRAGDADDRGRAPQVLAHVLDQSMRLLHPFVPFVTEAIWEDLARLAPRRGIDRELPISELLVHARWPEARGDWEDEALERRFAFAQQLIRAIRDVRSKYTVPARDPLTVRIRATGARAEDVEASAHLIRRMANVGELEIGPEVERARDAASAVVEDVEAFVCGVIDLAKERARLDKQRAQNLKEIERFEKKLSNPGFLAKAAPEVVAKERARLETARTELARIEANLAALDA